MKRCLACVILCLAGWYSLSAQVLLGTNAPGSFTDFTIPVGAAATNLSLTVEGDASAYSYLLIKRGSPATDANYDFSSRLDGVTNAVYLEQPEVAPGTYYIRVRTPLTSPTHVFSLTGETNRIDLRSTNRPVTKLLNSLATGKATAGVNGYFRVELLTNTFWRIRVDATNQTSPDLFVARGQLPTAAGYLKRSVNVTNDLLGFTSSEGVPGAYYIGLFGAGAPAGGVPYTMHIDWVPTQDLAWDPGLTHLGTQVYTNLNGVAGDYYFRMVTANPALAAWRTALRLLTTNEANLYLSRGLLPSPDLADYKSERVGSDGFVLGTPSQFQPSEEWFILVRAKAGAQWTLVSGSPFVTDLGTVATDSSGGSGDVEVGPEGMRFFSASAPAEMLAWRLWLNGSTNVILMKKTSLPLPSVNELTQVGQMLVVPPYLSAGQYLIGVSGAPGSIINLDSRQQDIVDVAYGGTVNNSVTGFGYVTYRVQVPPQQIAWQMYLAANPTNGNPNLAVRRNTVPNENNNDAYSELTGLVPDNITLVPPVLSDGTFYLTVYSTNGFGTNALPYSLQNGPATVTDINYSAVIQNDDPARVGWRFYRVADINQQLGSLGWDLFVTNFAPGTRIALRHNAAPSLWNLRNPNNVQANYYDLLSAAEFLQHPAHQADVWYVGVYNPTNALGAFTLITRELPAATLTDNTPMVRSNVLNGRWEFFRIQLSPSDIQLTNPLGPVMGWELRLVDATSGLPRIVVRRDGFPTNLTSSFNTAGTTWPSGSQWAAGGDWTHRSFSAGGTNEDGRILSMAVGRPLEPATYYIGILNSTGTNNMSYTLLSRWIGPGRALPIQDLTWSGGTATNVLSAREPAYYRVLIPSNSPSWKVRLTPLSGEAMLVATTNWLPTVDSEKRMQKTGKEHYVLLPMPGAHTLSPGTNFLTLVGEGDSPADNSHIGTGTSTVAIETLGPMPETDLGTLAGTDLLATNSLDGGESIAYHFHTTATTLGFYLSLEDTVGNPWMVSRGTADLADPGLGSDTYGNEGGQSGNSAASPFLITVADPFPTETIMVKARQSSGVYPDSGYTLRVSEILPPPVAFDGGTFVITDQPAAYESFFYVDVPPDALGWDLRLTNVTSGSVQLIIGRDVLPLLSGIVGLSFTSTNFPSGATWGAGQDWTGRTLSADGTNETGRILAMGMGRPLEPGRYYVGLKGAAGATPVSCTLLSRGIGTNYSIPVTELPFAGGQVTVPGLAVREAAYYHVVVPTNAASWKVRLSGANGETMLIALKDALPNVLVGQTVSQGWSVTNSSGRKMEKIGDEQFLLLPPPGQDRLVAGSYYLAVVSEGLNPIDLNHVGSGASSFTLASLGQAPLNYLGVVGAVELADTNSLGGGEVRIYQFNVPAGIESVEARLDNRTGNPVMALVPGTRPPDPGAVNASIPVDPYGNDGGESPGIYVAPSLLTVVNPSNTLYTVVVKARAVAGVSGVISNASYTLRLNASTTLPIDFDQGTATVAGQPASTWRYFSVVVPTNALGWDIRLINVTSGVPHLVVRRESLPNTLNTTPWSQPGTYSTWATNYQWAPLADWTRRSLSVDGTVNEDGRILAMGLNRPLEPGTYYIGVNNANPSANMAYTVLSRGIGPGFSIPLLDLPFVGALTNFTLSARDAAYYRVIVPSNTPSWKLKVAGTSGECMLVALRNALPNFDTANPSGTLANGKAMQKLGNEHYSLLPVVGQTNVPAGTNYLAVISEGVNPGTSGRIGPGSSSYVVSSFGAVPILDLGLLTSDDLVQPDNLEGGEVKAYQFTVPDGMYGVKVHLENRVNNPVVVALSGNRLPDPGAAVGSIPGDTYGNEGGYAPSDGHSTIVTLPNPVTGLYSLTIKARSVGANYPDASYTLRLQEILAPEINFTSELNTNGLSNSASGLLEDNERAFFKVTVPATINGNPVIGWKLDLAQSSGLASMRVRKDLLPSDANANAEMPFANASAIIAPPYLTNGTWFVEVKATGSTVFTLQSSTLTLQRPPWVMPAPGQTNQTPGVTLPIFADTGIGTNGLPISGDQSIFLEQGSLHYYAVQVPGTNLGLLRVQLEAISGNPDLYFRVGSVPTLYHNLNGGPGTVYDRSMIAASGTEYANWVPLDGKLESQLKPGLWYLAVRAASNANARYRLRCSVGNILDLPIHSDGLTNQIVAGGDWRYFRVPMPTALPLTFNVTFNQQSGDVVMYMRDTVPPGNGITASQSDLKDWSNDLKNFGPYPNFDLPNTYSFAAPPVRPGQALYLGFRAASDAIFSVQVTTNGLSTQEPPTVAFYGGTATTNVPPFSAILYRIDVPPEATRWKHTSTHPTNLVVYLDQGTMPTRTGNRWTSPGANSALNNPLVTWNDPIKHYLPAAWPWVPNQSYFLMVTNVTAAGQDFTLMMDGKNSATDDSDTDTLPDAWELLYFGNLTQIASGDPDHDGIANLDENLESTDPTDPNSYRARLFLSASNGTVLRQPDLPSYALGSSVVLTPMPNTGYSFIGWSGQASGLNNPLTLIMDSHKTVSAKFKLAGDDFISALPLVGASVVVNGSNVSYTKELGEPNHAGNPGGKSIWWRWVAPASGPFTITTAGSTFNTLLAVYTGPTVSNLTWIASDINSTGGTNRSVVNFNAVAGTAYNIAVDGYNGASAKITLRLTTSAVVTPPHLSAVTVLPNGTLRFIVSGDPNQTYAVEGSQDLVHWATMSSVTTSSAGLATFSDPTATNAPVRFYRARL